MLNFPAQKQTEKGKVGTLFIEFILHVSSYCNMVNMRYCEDMFSFFLLPKRQNIAKLTLL